MELTFLGHAGFLLNIGDKSLLIDPFLKNNPVASHKPGDLKADYVLITHGHSDHIGDSFEIAKNSSATVVSIVEIARYAGNQSLKSHGLNIGGSYDFGDFKVKLTQAIHSSAIPASEPIYMGLAAGFLIKTQGKTIYHAGDTALFSDMSLLAREKIDLALLPIGDNYTMGPEDALEAIKLIKPGKVIPMHYNTWPLISQDAEKFKVLVEKETSATVEILLPGVNTVL